MNKNKNLAFTLAEVLIVIGIIGVVAALTLPNLNHATGDKERVTKVKKIYGALTEAFDRAQAIYGNFSSASWFEGGSTQAEKSKRLGKRITEFMKISKECGLEVNQGCFSSGEVKYLSGGTGSNYDNFNSYFKVVTADGMSIAFADMSGYGLGAYIYVDIDGPNRGSYTAGKDLFEFVIDKDSNLLHPFNLGSTGDASFYRSRIYSDYSGTNWILENDNADYLKADFSTGKCNDSDIILDGTTNTSCH